MPIFNYQSLLFYAIFVSEYKPYTVHLNIIDSKSHANNATKTILTANEFFTQTM